MNISKRRARVEALGVLLARSLNGKAATENSIELGLLASGQRVLGGIDLGLGVALSLQLGHNVEPVSDELHALVVALKRNSVKSHVEQKKKENYRAELNFVQ